MKRLGIIGGLGPMASAYFLQLIVQMTDAKTDQEHIDVILYSRPQVPDRTRYILGESSDNPMPWLIDIGKSLTEQGAFAIAIPCVTAHFFQKQLEDEIGAHIINAIEETAIYLKSEGIKSVGIMATEGTIQSKLFQNIFQKYDIICSVPDTIGQSKIMHIIYDNVKAGTSVDMDMFRQVSEMLLTQGAEMLLLGCTELSMIKRDYEIGKGYLDIMEVLARKSVLLCGRLKKEYEHLIKK